MAAAQNMHTYGLLMQVNNLTADVFMGLQQLLISAALVFAAPVSSNVITISAADKGQAVSMGSTPPVGEVSTNFGSWACIQTDGVDSSGSFVQSRQNLISRVDQSFKQSNSNPDINSTAQFYTNSSTCSVVAAASLGGENLGAANVTVGLFDTVSFDFGANADSGFV